MVFWFSDFIIHRKGGYAILLCFKSCKVLKNNLKDLVRDSVEETLNALLDHEADELVRAGKYERTGDRKGYRSGHYERNFGTTSGEVKLRVPKLKGIQFETAIIERYKRRGCSVEEASSR